MCLFFHKCCYGPPKHFLKKLVVGHFVPNMLLAYNIVYSPSQYKFTKTPQNYSPNLCHKMHTFVHDQKFILGVWMDERS